MKLKRITSSFLNVLAGIIFSARMHNYFLPFKSVYRDKQSKEALFI